MLNRRGKVAQHSSDTRPQGFKCRRPARVILNNNDRICRFTHLAAVAVAREDREPRIFDETEIRQGKFAKDKPGAAGRFNPARMRTVRTEACRSPLIRNAFVLLHKRSISQLNGVTHAPQPKHELR